jgi:acetyl-CoA acetyltransferase
VEEIYWGAQPAAKTTEYRAQTTAGFPVEIPALTMNRLCASGLAAVNQAARAIRAGEGNMYIAGGVESMSRAPYSIPKAENPFSFGNLTAWDTTLGWRYPNPKMQEMYGTESMGETAENLAEMYPELTREKQDAFALRSNQLAVSATDSGRFAEEIVPVSIPQRKGDPRSFADERLPRCVKAWDAYARLFGVVVR